MTDPNNELQGNVELIHTTPIFALGSSSSSDNPQPNIINSYDENIENLNTLDEPICMTLKRDILMIGLKLKYVLTPVIRKDEAKALRNWDLWGPLLLCLLLAFMLSWKTNSTNGQVVFGTVFVVVWIGAFILTLNAQLLGGKISFFQSVCVIGYCIFPISIGAIILILLDIFVSTPLIVTVLIAALSGVWSIISSIGFMKALVSEEKKLLAAYPVVLFYISLCWFVLIVSDNQIKDNANNPMLYFLYTIDLFIAHARSREIYAGLETASEVRRRAREDYRD